MEIVNKYITSQMCWRCGEKEDTKKVGQANHICDECELNDNCDNNGATNIQEKGLGKDIQPRVYEPSNWATIMRPLHRFVSVSTLTQKRNLSVTLRASPQDEQSSAG